MATSLQTTIAPTPTLNPDELFKRLQDAREEYAGRHADRASDVLEEIQKQLPGSNGMTTSPELAKRFALLEASLLTVRGRLLRRSEQSRTAFEKAVTLFKQYADAIPETTDAFSQFTSRFDVHIYTDYGIALFRTYRNDEAIRILTAVCNSGTAPVDALAYLGYAEMNRKDYASAETRLRTALQLSLSDATVCYWLGRVLCLQDRKSEAAIVFCDAGVSAYNLVDYCSAGRYGLWALRLEPQSEPALRLVVAAYYEGDRLGLALLVVEKYIEKQPSNISASGWKGMLLRECGRIEDSISHLQGIEVRSAEEAWILGELVQSLLSLDRGNTTEAVAAARKAVELSPQDAALLRLKARVLAQRGEFEEAVKDLRRADSITPDQKDLVIELGEALIYANDIGAAAELFSNAASKFPTSPEAQFGLGYCRELQQQYELAVTHYRRSIRLEPNYPQPLLRLLDLLIEQGLTQEAMEEIELQVSGPLSYIALMRRGTLLAENKKWPAALDDFQKAVAAARQANVLHTWPEMLLNLGDALRQLGDYAQARQIYDEARELGRDNTNVLSALAGCHCDLAEFSKASDILDEALAMPAGDDDSVASLWLLKGWSLQHLGEFAEARTAYQKAVDLSKGKDAWSRKGLANVLMEFDPKEARGIFAELLAEQKYRPNAERVTGPISTNSTLLGLLGWCNYRLGRYEEATRLYQSLLSQSQDSVTEFFDLGLTLLAARRIEPARQAYRHGFNTSSESDTGRMRGQYYVALFDLADALRHKVIDPNAARPFMDELTTKLAASGIDVKQLTWLS
jgi:tetratricopeptide (TPR) repeat protein